VLSGTVHSDLLSIASNRCYEHQQTPLSLVLSGTVHSDLPKHCKQLLLWASPNASVLSAQCDPVHSDLPSIESNVVVQCTQIYPSIASNCYVVVQCTQIYQSIASNRCYKHRPTPLCLVLSAISPSQTPRFGLSLVCGKAACTSCPKLRFSAVWLLLATGLELILMRPVFILRTGYWALSKLLKRHTRLGS
jgi:hypothetical protein